MPAHCCFIPKQELLSDHNGIPVHVSPMSISAQIIVQVMFDHSVWDMDPYTRR